MKVDKLILQCVVSTKGQNEFLFGEKNELRTHALSDIRNLTKVI